MAITKQNTNSFSKTIARLFSVQALGLACGFLTHLILARTLTPADYGVFNFIISLAMLCALVGTFGFQTSSVRLIPQFMLERKAKWMEKFYKFSSLWVLLLSSIIGIITFGLLSQLTSTDQYPHTALIIGVIITPLIALIRLNSGFLKGFKKASWALAYESSLKEILLLAALAIIIVIGLPFTSAQLALDIIFLIFFALLITSFAHAKKVVRTQKTLLLHMQESPLQFAPEEDDQPPPYKRWLLISLPMMLVVSAQMVIHRSDIVLLGLLTSASDVGIYSAGAKLAQAATLFMMVLNIVFSPRASETFHQGNIPELKRLYLNTLKLQAISTLILSALVFLSAGTILGYLGIEYEQALPVVYILLGGYVLNALWGPVPFLMIMTDYERQAMWLTFAAAALNILLNIVLIPLYGILGAAISTVVTLNLRNGIALFYILSQGLFSESKANNG